MCNKGHVAFTCGLLRALEPEAKRKALEDSGLCLFYIKHLAETECFGKGVSSKPACKAPECKGLHAERLHDLLTGETSSVSALDMRRRKTTKKGLPTQRQENMSMKGITGGESLTTHGWI
jgi:hypothetical protein